MTAPKRRKLSESAAEWCVRSVVNDPVFWEKTRVEGDCLVYTGHRDRQGYGVVGRKSMGPSPQLAHRYAWTIFNGPILQGVVIRHSCDNPPCVRPDHLLDGTQADNIADRQARGRHRPGHLSGIAHPQAKLDEDDVLWVRRAWASRRHSQQDMARYLGVHISTVHRITSGRGWKHIKDAT